MRVSCRVAGDTLQPRPQAVDELIGDLGKPGALVFLAAPAMIGAAVFVLILASIATGENSWEAAFGP